MLSAPFNPALAFVGMMATLSVFATFSLIDGILLGDPTPYDSARPPGIESARGETEKDGKLAFNTYNCVQVSFNRRNRRWWFCGRRDAV
jgi:hypothetical protein